VCYSYGTQTNTKYNQLSSAIQICIYDLRSNKNQKTSKNETAMIVSRIASESIRNTNETKASNKNINKICKKNDETAPKYVGYVEIYCKK